MVTGHGLTTWKTMIPLATVNLLAAVFVREFGGARWWMTAASAAMIALWGVIGLVVMAGMWGIIAILRTSFF